MMLPLRKTILVKDCVIERVQLVADGNEGRKSYEFIAFAKSGPAERALRMSEKYQCHSEYFKMFEADGRWVQLF